MTSSPRDLRMSLPNDRRAPAQARQFTRHALQDLPQRLVDDALLIVSELVTNACQHAGGPRWVAVDPDEGRRIRIEVADSSPQPPLTSADKLGVRLALALSDEWGVDYDDHGKVVWSEVDTGR